MKVSSQSDLQNISEADRVHVTEDITITDDFNTISTFSGVFDGNGHTISNLTIPFISEVTDQAKIKNTMFKSSEAHIFTENRGKLQSISVANTHIHNTDYSEEEIGILTPKNFGEITDCTVSDSSIKSNFQYMGGIAGRTGENSQIKLCSVENTSLSELPHLLARSLRVGLPVKFPAESDSLPSRRGLFAVGRPQPALHPPQTQTSLNWAYLDDSNLSQIKRY